MDKHAEHRPQDSGDRPRGGGSPLEAAQLNTGWSGRSSAAEMPNPLQADSLRSPLNSNVTPPTAILTCRKRIL